MANMLIRTSRVCKYKHAVVLRILFFFGIPFFYFLFLRVGIIETNSDDSDIGSKFKSRNLLSLPGSENCTKPAILEFPSDGLTRSQRQHGFILIHCVLAIYCFLLLGTVCEQYFVPAIKIICERLNMASDIAGATFMAAASSSPELFINCVGTFVTEGDLGVGAVVGSAVFNVLAVPACCALVAGRVIELDWWSVSRDCLMYAVAVVALILSLLDDKVYWHEALLLVLMYTLYILAMVFNGRLGRFARSGCCIINKPKPFTEVTPLLNKGRAIAAFKLNWAGTTGVVPLEPRDYWGDWSEAGQRIFITSGCVKWMSMSVDSHQKASNNFAIKKYVSKNANYDKNKNLELNGNKYEGIKGINDIEKGTEMRKRCDSTDSDVSVSSIWSWPDEKTSACKKFQWILTWPISLLLWGSIPDCRRHPNLYPVTFIMCITWIGGVSYLVAWIITVVGDTMDVPDSITGLTILAAGTSLPEAVSSVLVTNQGHGTMGISNSIGSNTFDILLCLGLPWLIKALCYPSEPGHHWVRINSSGLSYSAISLLSTLIAFYTSLALNKFQLDWKIGVNCAIIYFGFLIFAALIELNMFFVVNLPTCAH